MKRFSFFSVALLAAVLFLACEPNEPKNNEVTSIELNETTLALEVGDSQTLTATVLPDDAIDKAVTWTSSNISVVSVSKGIVIAISEGTAIITAKAGDKTATCEVTVTNVVKGVLINGVRWATSNVGAFGTFAETPESAGMFYQWNKPTAWAATGDVTNWDTSEPEGGVWTKANDPSPNGWRVPTEAEIQKLLDATYVTSEWTTLNEVSGYRFTDNATGNSIFLPAAGHRYDVGTIGGIGMYGLYWSSSEADSGIAYHLYFNSGNANVRTHNTVCGGSIRSVAE